MKSVSDVASAVMTRLQCMEWTKAKMIAKMVTSECVSSFARRGAIWKKLTIKRKEKSYISFKVEKQVR